MNIPPGLKFKITVSHLHKIVEDFIKGEQENPVLQDSDKSERRTRGASALRSPTEGYNPAEKCANIENCYAIETRYENHPGLDEAIVDGCGLPHRMKREGHGDQRECLRCFSRVGQVTQLTVGALSPPSLLIFMQGLIPSESFRKNK